MLVGASLRYSQASSERMQGIKVLFINIYCIRSMPTKRLMCYIQTSLFSAQAAVASMIAEIIADKLL